MKSLEWGHDTFGNKKDINRRAASSCGSWCKLAFFGSPQLFAHMDGFRGMGKYFRLTKDVIFLKRRDPFFLDPG